MALRYANAGRCRPHLRHPWQAVVLVSMGVVLGAGLPGIATAVLMLLALLAIASCFIDLGWGECRRHPSGVAVQAQRKATESKQHSLVAIHALLLSMFSGAELRRFIRFGEQGDAICARLPGECASLAELVDGVLEQLRQRGLVPDTLARLRDEFPHRLADIDVVGNVWTEAPNRRTGKPA